MPMTLRDFIAAIGEQAAANLFGASVFTIRSWRKGTRHPRAEMAQRIVALTGGRVTFAGIYGQQKDAAQ